MFAKAGMAKRMKSKKSQADINELLQLMAALRAEFVAAQETFPANDQHDNHHLAELVARYSSIQQRLALYIPAEEIEAVESAFIKTVEDHLNQIDVMSVYAGANALFEKQIDAEVESRRARMNDIKERAKERQSNEGELLGISVPLIFLFGLGIPFTIIFGMAAAIDKFGTFLLKAKVRSGIASTQLKKLEVGNQFAGISAELIDEQNHSPAKLLRQGFFSLANSRYNHERSNDVMPVTQESWDQVLPSKYDHAKSKREFIKQERQRERNIKAGTLELRFAVLQGYLQSAVNLIEKHGHDPLIMNGDGPYIRRGAYNGRSCLLIAVHKNNAAMARALLKSPVIDINYVDDLYWDTNYSEFDRYINSYNTPLTAALGLRRAELAEILLDSPKIDVNVATSRGQTPLICAVRRSPQFIRRLLAFDKIDVNAQDRDGRTALHYACFTEEKNKKYLDALLKAPGLKPDLIDKHEAGWTPLMYAAKVGDKHLVRALIAIGADPAFTNTGDLNAERIAGLHGHKEIEAYIKEKAANQAASLRPKST